MTNSDVIERALRHIGVLSEVAHPSAEQGVVGLAAMNGMAFVWESDGIDLQWSLQTSTTAPCPIPDEVQLAFEYNLACMLAPDFEKQPSPIVVSIATSTYDRLLRQSTQDLMQPSSMRKLPRGEGQWKRWWKSILTDLP